MNYLSSELNKSRLSLRRQSRDDNCSALFMNVFLVIICCSCDSTDFFHSCLLTARPNKEFIFGQKSDHRRAGEKELLIIKKAAKKSAFVNKET